MERTWLTFHCWLYNLCIVVYVTNKAWNLKLETWNIPLIISQSINQSIIDLIHAAAETDLDTGSVIPHYYTALWNTQFWLVSHHIPRYIISR